MDSACLACAFFAASSASRAAFSASFCFFTFHFGGVVTLMMVFRLGVGVSPSVFRFSVSTGRFCSVMIALTFVKICPPGR